MYKQQICKPEIVCQAYKLYDKTADIVDSLLPVILVLLTIYIKLQRKSADMLNKLAFASKRDNNIRSVLMAMLQQTGATRVLLGMLHNGRKFAINYHPFELTITHGVGQGHIQLMRRITGIPLVYLQQELNVLFEKKKMYVDLANKALNDDCVAHLLSLDTYAMANYGIFYKTTLIGIVSLQFANKPIDITDCKSLEAKLDKPIKHYLLSVLNELS